ncbi:NYN domain-containing protein [Campylobacter helveticus]|uniref:NYN domain-containing protein n=1 Tax=Campylobacter helveticus TaxID=28898 RepID=UPI0031192A6B
MENKSIAIFIDAENVSPKYAKDIFNIVSDYGEIVVKRIYADWTSKTTKGWKEHILEHSIIAMQNFRFNSQKNSSDMYLMADAMSMFYEKDIEIFIIVSSDSDYIPLVHKIRENKKQVVGIVENKANQSYINAFNEFHYLNKKQEKSDELIKELFNTIDQLIEEKNRAEYSQIPSIMQRKYPDFNRQNYGCSSFKELINKFIDNNYKKEVANDGCTYYLVKN